VGKERSTAGEEHSIAGHEGKKQHWGSRSRSDLRRGFHSGLRRMASQT
jgi:hypothetical protein